MREEIPKLHCWGETRRCIFLLKRERMSIVKVEFRALCRASFITTSYEYVVFPEVELDQIRSILANSYFPKQIPFVVFSNEFLHAISFFFAIASETCKICSSLVLRIAQYAILSWFIIVGRRQFRDFSKECCRHSYFRCFNWTQWIRWCMIRCYMDDICEDKKRQCNRPRARPQQEWQTF